VTAGEYGKQQNGSVPDGALFVRPRHYGPVRAIAAAPAR